MRRFVCSSFLRSVILLALLNISFTSAGAANVARTRPHRTADFSSWMSGTSYSSSSFDPSSPDNWLGGTGYWDNPANWSAGEPGAGSDVFINTGNDSVTLDVNARINSLTLGGSTGSSTLADTLGRGLLVQIAGALTINQSGTLTLAGDTITANANSSNAGQVNLYNGSKLVLGGAFTNSGTIQLASSFVWPAITVSGDMTNSGTIIDEDFTAVLSVGGTLTNSGSIAIYGLTSGPITNTSTGNLDVQMLSVNGNLVNAGEVFGLSRGSQLSIAGELTNSGRFDYSYANATLGSLNNLPNGLVFGGEMLTVNGNTSNAGAIVIMALGPNEPLTDVQLNGNVTNSGTIGVSGPSAYESAVILGSVVNSGGISVEDGGVLSIRGNITNSGMIITGGQNQPGSNSFRAASLTNLSGGVLSVGSMSDAVQFGSVTNAGTISIANGATLTVPVSSHATGNALSGFLNSGVVQIASGGTISSLGKYTQTAGQTTIDGLLQGSSNFAGGAVYGNGGSIQGNVTSNAAFNMGDMPMTVGNMMINGNYTQGANGSLAFDIASQTSYDQLNIAGHASLNGTLFVDLLNGYTPQIGNMFDIMNFSGSSGTFSMVLGLPINGQEHFVLEYNSTDLTLDVVAGPDNLPTSGRANGNVYYYEPYVSDVMQGSNPIDNLGSLSASSVPEPGSIVLLFSGIVGIAGLRRKIAR